MPHKRIHETPTRRPEALLTRRDVCEILKVSHDTVRRYEQRGQLPCIALSKHTIRYRNEDVQKLIEDWSCKRRR